MCSEKKLIIKYEWIIKKKSFVTHHQASSLEQLEHFRKVAKPSAQGVYYPAYTDGISSDIDVRAIAWKLGLLVGTKPAGLQ